MSKQLVSRLAAALSVILLLAALVVLQLPSTGRLLLPGLTAYTLVAAAALIAIAARRFESGADLVCVASCALFVGYIVARALTSPVPYVARPDLYSVLAGAVIYGLVVGPFASWAMRLAALVPLLALATVHVTVTLVQAGLGENLSLLVPSLAEVKTNTRGTGFFFNPNHLAGFLEVVGLLGLSLTCWSRWPAWARVLLGYLSASCFLGLVLSGSRGGYLSAVAGLLVFALLSLLVLRAAGALVTIKAGGAGLVVIGAVVFGLWQLIQQNESLSSRIDEIASDTGRPGLWNAAIEQWKLEPLFGTGSGTYLYYGRQFRAEQMQQDPVHAHNDYLELLGEYGALGAIGFLLFLLAHLRRGWLSFLDLGTRRAATGAPLLSTRLALVIGALSVLAAYAVHSLVDFNLHIPANALLLAFVFGMLANPGLTAGSGRRSTSATYLTRIALAGVALVLLVQCIRLLPGEYYADEARMELWRENPAAAIEFARQALQHEEKKPQVFFHLGRALVAMVAENASPEARAAAYEDAIVVFRQGWQVAPLDTTFPLEIAFLYGELGRFAEAEPLYRDALTRDPRSDAVKQVYRHHQNSWQKSMPAHDAAPPGADPPPPK